MRALTERDKQSICKLDIIQKHLENEICFAAIDAENLHHEEKDIIIRGFIFSQGEREEAIAIGEDGIIYYHNKLTHKTIKPNLIDKVCNCLLNYLLFSTEGEQDD
jgi:hypothetical protein|tara:strand:+ start:1367 stop:1681 length:315 start_codon:yes stop_codon:yes gene_type:complete